MKNKKKVFVSLFLILLTFSFTLVLPKASLSASGYEYKLLEAIPGVANKGTSPSFGEYASAIYKFALGMVGISALLMISIGAFMYLTSAGNNAAMSNAKDVITDALIGLALALLAYILLYTINPNLLSPSI